LEKGAYFGEYAILSNKPTKRSMTVKSVEFTELFSLSKAAFDDVLRVYPELHHKIARKAAQQLKQIMAAAPKR
jgi:CRP-like cAMP-binding protein